MLGNCVVKVTLPVLRVHCGTINRNQSEECECVMEFPSIHFNVLRNVRPFREFSIVRNEYSSRKPPLLEFNFLSFFSVQTADCIKASRLFAALQDWSGKDTIPTCTPPRFISKMLIINALICGKILFILQYLVSIFLTFNSQVNWQIGKSCIRQFEMMGAQSDRNA